MPLKGMKQNDTNNKIQLGTRRNGKLRVRCKEAISCPICNGGFKSIGSRPRKIIEAGHHVRILIIRRLRCNKCTKIHHELPDILIPYKRHSAETIESVIDSKSGKDTVAAVDDNTVRRIKLWWKNLLPYLMQTINTIRIKYKTTYSSHMAPRKMIRAAVNAHLYLQTRSSYSPG